MWVCQNTGSFLSGLASPPALFVLRIANFQAIVHLQFTNLIFPQKMSDTDHEKTCIFCGQFRTGGFFMRLAEVLILFQHLVSSVPLFRRHETSCSCWRVNVARWSRLDQSNYDINTVVFNQNTFVGVTRNITRTQARLFWPTFQRCSSRVMNGRDLWIGFCVHVVK